MPKPEVPEVEIARASRFDIGDKVRKLIDAFCPGPITFVLRRKNIVPNIVTNGMDTVGVRIPDNAIARKLIRLVGMPIAAPSANTSGRLMLLRSTSMPCSLSV